MEDVLFAGTDKQPPLNLAEVSLTFTEAASTSTLGYEEITVTRRLHRSGESEYLLNQKQVRLKDIQNLFLGSGIGKNSFSIFEQGKLDQIIYQTPLERRAIFEESAGIGRFLQRKKEVLKHLEEVSANYLRIKDVHAEVERQTRALKRQAELAESYHKKQTELTELERAVVATHLRTLNQEESQLAEQRRQIEEEKSRLGLELERSSKTEERQELLMEEELLETAKRLLREKEREILIQEGEFSREKERLLEWQERLQRALRERKRAFEAKEALQEELRQAEVTARRLRGEKREAQEAVEQSRLRLEQLVEKLERAKDQERAHQKKTMACALHLQQCKGYLEQKRAHVASSERKQATLREQKEERRRLLVGLEEKLATKKGLVVALKEEAAALGVAKEEACQEAAKSARDLESLKKEHGGRKQELVKSEAQLLALSHLRKEKVGFTQGARRLLEESDHPKSPLFGLLRPLIEGWEVAQVHFPALALFEQALAVATFEGLKKVVSFAKEKQIVGFSLFCLEGIEEPLDHLLEGVKRASTLEESLEMRSRGSGVVVEEDYFLYPKGLLVHTRGQEPLFQREAEYRQLQDLVEKMQREVSSLSDALEGVFRVQEEMAKRERKLDEELRKKEIVLLQENFAQTRLAADLEQMGKEEARLESEAQQLAETLKRLTQEIKELTSTFERASLENERVLAAALGEEAAVRELTEEVKRIEGEKSARERGLHELSLELRRIEQQLEMQKRREEEWGHEEGLFAKEIKEGEERIEASQRACEERQQLLLSRIEERRLIQLQLEEQTQKVVHHKERWQKEERESELKRKRMETLLFEEKRHGLVKEKMDHRRQQLLERVSEEMDPDRVEPLSESVEQTEKLLFALKRELAAAVPVGMEVLGAYKEQEERLKEADGALGDLLETKKELEGTLAKLERESRKLFKENFGLIRENFRKNFALLFEGGEADLRFVEGQDILEAGIEIMAKPPGKQLKVISLLSGGEKCLTALALLFSLFELRIAPFCILDEVDAPLDEANIGRFTRLLKQFTERTHFIVVTHNKKTMAVADQLIGVSMAEKGVSTLLCLSFDEASELALTSPREER